MGVLDDPKRGVRKEVCIICSLVFFFFFLVLWSECGLTLVGGCGRLLIVGQSGSRWMSLKRRSSGTIICFTHRLRGGRKEEGILL